MPLFLLQLLLPLAAKLISKHKPAIAGFVSAEMEKGLAKLDIPFLPDAGDLAVKTNLRLVAQHVVSAGLDYAANSAQLIKKP